MKTHNLLTTRNYILGYHPHGIMGLGAFCNFSTEATEVSKKFPGIRPYLATLAGNFRMPVLREYLMSGGENPSLLILTGLHCPGPSLPTEQGDRLAWKPAHHSVPALRGAACRGRGARAAQESCSRGLRDPPWRASSLGSLLWPLSWGAQPLCCPLNNPIVVYGSVIIPRPVTPSSLIQGPPSTWRQPGRVKTSDSICQMVKLPKQPCVIIPIFQ